MCTFVHAVIHHHYFFPALRTGLHMRMSLIALMYRKCMSLSMSSSISTGAIINLISNDVQPFENASCFATWAIIGPIQAVVIIVLLYREIGVSVFAGLCAFVFLLPLQTYFAKRFSRMREETVMYRDERIRSLSDVLSGIDLVKLSSWEDPLSERISELREKELKYIGKANNMRAFNMASYFFFQSVISLFTFVTYWATGNPLRPDKVFVSLTLFNVIRLTMTSFFPQALATSAEAHVSAKRIKEFLLLPELKPLEPIQEALNKISKEISSTSVDKIDLEKNNEKANLESFVRSDSILEMNDAAFNWAIGNNPSAINPKEFSDIMDEDKAKEADHCVVQNLSFKLGHNELLAVVGPVGSGKTSLCMAILKELHLDRGTMNVSTKLDGKPIQIAYAAQSPWLFAGTVKENILFGAKFDPARFRKVVQVCQLERDFLILSNGEETLIGERGVTLSGGQKARVALARAVYQKADLYILDDPLSAVDPHVGFKMFDECIRGFLKDKAVILATHQLQYVKDCNSVLVLESGIPTYSGPSRDILSATSPQPAQEATTEQLVRKTFIDVLREYYQSDGTSITTEVAENNEENDHLSKRSSISSLVQEGDTVVDAQAKEYDPKANQLVAEDRNMGGTSLRTYVEFFKVGSSNFYLYLVIFSLFVGQGFSVAADFFLSKWTGYDDQKQEKQENAGIFAALAVLTVIFASVRALLFFKALHNSSKGIFKVMLNAVLNTDINFFQTQPQGRILNRFSKDQANCDELLPWNFFDAVQCFFMLLGSIVVVCIVNPWIIISLPFLGFVFYTLRRFYMLTSRQVKQIESTTRSPVYSLLSETLDGLATIRAFGAQERFFDMFIDAENENCRAFFMYLCSARWLGFRLDILAATFLTITAFASVGARDTQSAGLVGLSLSYVLQLMGQLQWAVRQSIEVEITFVSVERMLSYTKLLPEGPRVTDVRPPKDWPQNAEVEFKEMSLTYPGSDKAVLQDINLKIRRHEKIGVVGRTGAGKSSLLTALFRLIEASPSGCIVIDGIPISDLGLHDLRKAISIIPQEPFLFKGTLRFNLDPFNEHDDQSVWKALELAELKDTVCKLPSGLDTPVTENGKNFSIGQRQLLSLTRAILRNTKLLVMDEATANVDLQSDRFIQRSIHTCFEHATVLTIAHRLNTVIGDYDRILVLDQGKVMEFDEPWVLLQNENGWLSGMVRSTGPESERELRSVARKQWERVHDDVWGEK
ncbi:P-loop containing nucleoside triphosphate hydrolase protein [Basidiobolus meristosporus CBS 931.73]|uniref:p-loop containing nucleoside triphosphate hydrolase protein n=1 Tax=Basidiobolus meristosporus CBS 931.73 TaxID=1314790 RepID=A0A1Y1Y8H8_9FUNG|nr:P-loop containing nucleoside triphosphate hydrolase protein [Basidiobolus meristosporus CBS 931.73]|eukprot:ORX94321.1 P-loop containing nucleoside triphosphate hydrolase protein [Basidiobolus meristosporus CBS 931.73]